MKLFKGSLIWMFLFQWLPVCSREGFLIKNVHLKKCIHVSPREAEKISLSDCKPHSEQFLWDWDEASGAIVSRKTRQCLTVRRPEEFAAVQLEPCGDHPHQAWVCNQKGHLILHRLGLHLSTQRGGQKAFLSSEKNKFRRWRTGTDEIICSAGMSAHPPEGSVVAWEQAPPSKTTTSPEMPVSPEDPTATSATPSTETTAEFSSSLPSKEEMSLVPEDGKPTHYKKEDAINQRKAAGAQYPGSRWKTVMLVLSPLAFILGLIILALNIHYNKKKKTIMSALKRGPEKSHQVGYKERLPFSRTTSASHKTQIIPSSPSPSLKHGEILIEWKDGTITPLFDHMSYPIC